MPQRAIPVPEGLAGKRADAALATLLGFSRTFAAEIIAAGGVRMNGVTLAKSDVLTADAMLEVNWQEKKSLEIVAVTVPDFEIVFDDSDFVVIDKPPGVAAHPSLGWEGPTVLGALAASGFRIATSGPPER